MERTEIESKLTDLLVDELGIERDAITMDAKFEEDLDVETLRALEDALENFAGCAVIISHDRWFLDRIATHILAFEGDSHVEWFPGPYSDYRADRKQRLGDEADRPHRVTYRPLTRS